MPDSIGNLMREATEQLPTKWDPPETIRRRGDRRKPRRRAVAVFVTIAALGLGGAVALSPAGTPEPPMPDPSASACVADLTLPQSEREVRLRVYHSAINAATSAAADFRSRGFEVVEAATADESTGDFNAMIRFGPAEVGEARLVQAHLPADSVTMEFDRTKTGTVDVFLGTRFSRLVTITQMRERMAALGPPVSPC